MKHLTYVPKDQAARHQYPGCMLTLTVGEGGQFQNEGEADAMARQKGWMRLYRMPYHERRRYFGGRGIV